MNTELPILFLLELKFTKCYYLNNRNSLHVPLYHKQLRIILLYMCILLSLSSSNIAHYQSLQSIKPRVSHCLSLRLFLRCNTL